MAFLALVASTLYSRVSFLVPFGGLQIFQIWHSRQPVNRWYADAVEVSRYDGRDVLQNKKLLCSDLGLSGRSRTFAHGIALIPTRPSHRTGTFRLDLFLQQTVASRLQLLYYRFARFVNILFRVCQMRPVTVLTLVIVTSIETTSARAHPVGLP